VVLHGRRGAFIRRRRAAAGGLVVAAVLVAGCTGFTTEATNIAQQPDGSYSAQLNFVGSCVSGEQCSWYAQYRLVGTTTWTNMPSTPRGPVAGPISNISLSESVTGLTPGAQYEYQVCGNSQPGQPFACVGPDGTPNTTTKFTTTTPANFPRTWYVDCSAAVGGDGSIGAPFYNLESANQLALGPGDQLLFRRGTVCQGMLEPRGNGDPGNPIVIGDYPSGGPVASLPTINGGGTVTAAVWLAQVSDITVEDLHLTNAGDPNGVHRGLYLTADTGPVNNVTIRDLEIDHVDAYNAFIPTRGPVGGIVGQALSTAGRFSTLLIEGNDVHDVTREGIVIWGRPDCIISATTPGSSSRPPVPATSPWPQASTGVVIQGNTVERIQGDGIVPTGTNGALVQYNLVEQGNLEGYNYLSPNKNCAIGIWALDANNTLIQYNEVSNMVYGPSTDPSSLNGCDGDGFDADSHQDGTVIQYNYSHDNAGGFVLLCTDSPPHRVVVRYNLSIDDNATFNMAPCDGVIDPATNNLNGDQMYNNTIVAPAPRVTTDLNESLAQGLSPLDGSFAFENNIVDATSPDAANHYFGCGSSCTNNVFTGMPVPPGATNSLTADPQFVAPVTRGSGLSVANAFRLQPASPAIGAGVPIPAGFPPPATHDFFGVPVKDPPSIGFSEGPGTESLPSR
jgi:hypothetical protein